MRLHFQVHGEGFPLIIAHGFLGSLDNWRTMSTRLAAHYRVYAVDLRNHGRSPHSNVMNYLVMAQDLREFIRRCTGSCWPLSAVSDCKPTNPLGR
jgi:esterase